VKRIRKQKKKKQAAEKTLQPEQHERREQNSMDADKKLLGLLGLAQRAGKLKSGEFSAEKSLQSRKAKLVIIAGDASDNTRKKFTDKAKFYEVPCLTFSSKEELGHAIGKELRTVTVIEDAGFSGAVRKLIEQ
jgi:ribosomal protein L7Ae-like RNA K-turn-binding protein